MRDLRKIRGAIKLGEDGGSFVLKSPVDSGKLYVIASHGGGWDHVSVSRKNRCPNWREMCFIKKQFFESEEAAFQLHPQESSYVNNHPYCLHLWRSQEQQMPLPPINFV